MHVYAEHASTEVLCLAYAYGDMPPMLWTAGDPAPQRLLEHIAAGAGVTAWNAPFELTIWEHVIGRDYPKWPKLKPEQTYCTMAQALALALPGSLDLCAKAMRVEEQKDKDGAALMRKMCKPLPQWTKNGVGEKWLDSPSLRANLGAYCKQDVITERAIGRRLAPLSERERKLWLLDYAINNRGVPIDLQSVNNAQRIVDAEAKRINRRVKKVTGEEVDAVTKAAALQGWLKRLGIELQDMRKNTVADQIKGLRATIDTLDNPTLPAALREEMRGQLQRALEALELRADGGLASVKKLKAMQASTSEDGRARGLFRYHVATTGRWAGARIQTQNMKRPTLEQGEIEDAIDLMRDARNGADMLRFTYGPPTEVIASCLRGMICASE